MPALPSSDILQAHGLTNIELAIQTLPSDVDLGSSTPSFVHPFHREEWVSGHARLDVADAFPLISSLRRASTRVRFTFCAANDHASMSRFRRQAQLLALDSLPGQPGSSNGPQFAHVKEVLAWWEDFHGLWLITEEDDVERIRLVDWWAKLMDGYSVDGVVVEGRGEQAWINACDVLVMVVDCLKAVHARRLAVQACRPHSFAINPSAPAHAELIRFSSLSPISSFALAPVLSAPFARSTLFSHHPLDACPTVLTDAFLSSNLRYLSPESATSRQVSPVDDVYSFGVLAYELVTGTTSEGGPESPEERNIDLLSDIHRHVAGTIIPVEEVLSREARLGGYQAQLPPQHLCDIIHRCLEKDPDDRYGSLDAVAYELSKLARIQRAGGDLSKFHVGEIDMLSKLALPKAPVHREVQLDILRQAFTKVHDGAGSSGTTRSNRAVNFWGVSGSGKTRVVRYFTEEILGTSTCTVAWAKMDESTTKPLSSFVQIFHALLDSSFTDPNQDIKALQKDIRIALGNQFSVFLSLLTPDARKLVQVGKQVEDVKEVEAGDWANILQAFNMWSKRFLQIFARPEKPLVIVVDDIQWMSAEEVQAWRQIMDGVHPLTGALVISTCRDIAGVIPPPNRLLSSVSSSTEIPFLTEAGVLAKIEVAFHHAIENGPALGSFLHAETNGSPLYLRTLIATLVKEGVIYFDFERVMWRYHTVALQHHLSESGLDAYFERLMRQLPDEVRELLCILSRLPSAGLSLDQLAVLLGKTVYETQLLGHIAASTANLVTIRNNQVFISHDRPRAVSFRMIPTATAAAFHSRISDFLRSPIASTLPNPIFGAADHALVARRLGYTEGQVVLVELLSEAGERALRMGGFILAKKYTDAADDIIEEDGGVSVWVERHRVLYMRFITLYFDVAQVLKLQEQSMVKMASVLPYPRLATDRIKLATIQLRSDVAANRTAEAMESLFRTLDEHGYNPYHPEKVAINVPETVEDVLALGRFMRANVQVIDDERLQIIGLISCAGPIIFISDPLRRKQVFALGISLVRFVNTLQESSGYVLLVYALVTLDVALKQAICQLYKELAMEQDVQLAGSSMLLAAQSHYWVPLDELHSEFQPAYELSVSSANFEWAGYSLMLEVGSGVSAPQPMSWVILVKRYEELRPVISSAQQFLLDAPLQCLEEFASYRPSEDREPWALNGPFLTTEDAEAFKHLPMHNDIRQILCLHLAVLFDAPLELQLDMVDGTRFGVSGIAGLVYEAQWLFLCSLVWLRAGKSRAEIGHFQQTLETYARSPDWRHRMETLDVLLDMRDSWIQGLDRADAKVNELDRENQHPLSGLLAFVISQIIIDATGNTRLAAGYIRAAFNSYAKAQTYGLCRMLKERYPDQVTDVPVEDLSPTRLMGRHKAESQEGHLSIKPGMSKMSSTDTLGSREMRTNTAASKITTLTSSSEEGPNEFQAATAEGTLDTLTLIRSSLALASEQDPSIILCTLLRILCQFVRADYGGIAFFDESDPTIIRLRAAGLHSSIVPYDLALVGDACQQLCPASIITQVARTGVAITSWSQASKNRADPFFQKTPRSILALPIMNQGKQAGVVVLSSSSTASTQAQSSSAREIVSTLATFATIVTSNYSFTHRLKLEVDQRTKELSNALAAKTQFLSQCSHELRSPLSAVLGLAAVLEASHGLSTVQREHLRTIISSGEDLLGLINNILDHSRLESGSVTLERIPFSLRDVVESALDTVAAVAQKKGLELCLISPFRSDPPGMLGDPFRVKQVLLNLLSNAVKFTSDGMVTIKWRWEDIAEGKVKIVLDVQDTGIGIPAQKMDKLFRSFSQIDETITRSFGGSGLGLVISKDLAQMLGGDCYASSNLGEGSTFTFTLTAEKEVGADVKIAPMKASKSCFILCNPGPWWDMLEKNLTYLNCEPVRFAESIAECLVRDHPKGLNSDKPYDYIFINTDMIDTSLLAKMKKLQPKAKFIYLVQSINLVKDMNTFDIPREAIVPRPIKFSALYNVVLPSADGSERSTRMPLKGAAAKKGINRSLSKTCPLIILLVDDNLVNVTVGKRILELFGYNSVTAANDGQQAVEAAERRPYDLILLDLQMPVLDGFQAQKRIQASPLAGEPAIVALTANADKSTQDRCVEAGFFSYLSKPLDIPKLETLLTKVYAHRPKAKMTKETISRSEEEDVKVAEQQNKGNDGR